MCDAITCAAAAALTGVLSCPRQKSGSTPSVRPFAVLSAWTQGQAWCSHSLPHLQQRPEPWSFPPVLFASCERHFPPTCCRERLHADAKRCDDALMGVSHSSDIARGLTSDYSTCSPLAQKQHRCRNTSLRPFFKRPCLLLNVHIRVGSRRQSKARSKMWSGSSLIRR